MLLSQALTALLALSYAALIVAESETTVNAAPPVNTSGCTTSSSNDIGASSAANGARSEPATSELETTRTIRTTEGESSTTTDGSTSTMENNPTSTTENRPTSSTEDKPPAPTVDGPPFFPPFAGPTEDVKCFPKHGSNPPKDEIIRPSGFNPRHQCRDKNSAILRFDNCRGSDPLCNNWYFGTFTTTEDAPEECGDIFVEGKVLSEVGVNLCTIPLEIIVYDCPWNGGEVRNVCGRFTLQSCPLGKECPVGDPS